MPPKRWLLRCEICGHGTHRKSNDEKRDFMAQFPLDENRCRQWVKAVGKEDLVYVPIERLHSSKFVCANHFELEAFNKKRNRLSRNFAVPTKNLTREPLPDDLFSEFPYHIASDPVGGSISQSEMLIEEHNYSISEQKKILALLKTPKSGPQKASSGAHEKPASKEHTDLNMDDDFTFDENVQDISENLDTEPEPAPPAFSWQGANSLITLDEPKTGTEIVPHAPFEEDLDLKNTSTVLTGETTEDISTAVTDYTCNECRQNIIGYTCVQCKDYDLCGACEATLIHPQHYMLRVPGVRPQGEVKMMLDAIRKKLEYLRSHANDGIAHVDCDLVIKKEEDPFEELPTGPVAHEEYASFQDISDHSQVPNISHPTYGQQRNRSSESELSDNPEFVPNNGNQRKASEQDMDDSRSAEWLDESLLELSDASFSDANEVTTTTRLKSSYVKQYNNATFKVPVVGKLIGESLSLQPNVKRKNDDASKEVPVIKLKTKKLLLSKNDKGQPTFIKCLYAGPNAMKILSNAVKRKTSEDFNNDVKQSPRLSKESISVSKIIGQPTLGLTYTRTLEPVDTQQLTTETARVICSLKKPVVRLEDISKTLLSKSK